MFKNKSLFNNIFIIFFITAFSIFLYMPSAGASYIHTGIINDFPSWSHIDCEQQGDYIKMIKNSSALISPEFSLDASMEKKLNFRGRTFGGSVENSAQITVFVSTDNGKNWKEAAQRTPERNSLSAVDPVDLTKYAGKKIRISLQTLSADGRRGVGVNKISIIGFIDSAAGDSEKEASSEIKFDIREYYSSAEGLDGEELKKSLYNIIKDHTRRSYDYVWTAFYETDRRGENNVWDIYSDYGKGQGGAYEYILGVHQDTGLYGNQREGECYNREHSFPAAWFKTEIGKAALYSDLFHIYPTDKYINARRGDYALGIVEKAEEIFTNKSRIGPNAYPGASGTAYEPIDEYKGDIARSFFYIAVRYYNEDADWIPEIAPMTKGSQFKEWAMNMLLEWHKKDPVSQKEIERNNAIYKIQNNRNPFIDRPEYARKIWGEPTFIYKPLESGKADESEEQEIISSPANGDKTPPSSGNKSEENGSKTAKIIYASVFSFIIVAGGFAVKKTVFKNKKAA